MFSEGIEVEHWLKMVQGKEMKLFKMGRNGKIKIFIW